MIIYGSISSHDVLNDNLNRSKTMRNTKEYIKSTMEQIKKRLSYKEIYLLFDRIEKIE